MWEILQQLKQWLTSIDYGTLPAPRSKDIIAGYIDLSRFESKILISLLPEDEDDATKDENDFIDGTGLKQLVTITILCRGESQQKLIEKISKYNEVICDAIRNDVELGGFATGCGIDTRKFYLDAGAVSEQVTAVEIPLTILYMKS